MVKQYEKEGKILFRCEVCNLGFLNQEIAQSCEDFCRKSNSCSMEITRQAVDFSE